MTATCTLTTNKFRNKIFR